MYRVFVSYAHADGAECATLLTGALNERQGVRCDYDASLQDHGIANVSGLEKYGILCDAFLPIVTDAYFKSKACHKELGHVLASNKSGKRRSQIQVLPVVFGDDPSRLTKKLAQCKATKPIAEILIVPCERKASIRAAAVQVWQRIAVQPVLNGNLRFDHPHWDYFEGFSDTFEKFDVKILNKTIFEASARGKDCRTAEDLTITFYGPLNLQDYRYLTITALNTTGYLPNVWDQDPLRYKFMKVILDNQILRPEIPEMSSPQSDFSRPVYSESPIKYVYRFRPRRLLFHKICLVSAPGTISRLQFSLSFAMKP